MAQNTVVTVVCDEPHDQEREAAETVEFAYNGARYEIDLCEQGSEEFRGAMGKYAEHARRISNTKTVNAKPVARRRRRPETKDIREWANEQGLRVSNRGRIPEDVISKYEAAH